MTERVALVTGGNRGIGLEVCRQLARGGLRVLLGSRSPERGQVAVGELRAEGLEVTACSLDVANPAGIAAARRFVEERFGRLDVLVNNAAIYADEDISVFHVPMETLRETLETNFFGPLMLCREFLPLMRAQSYGRIVNVSSGMGTFDEMEGHAASYRISKTALNAMTVIMAAELEGTNIKVNAVCPGWVHTEMGGAEAPRSIPEGADSIVWLAQLPDDGPSGGLFRDRAPVAW